MSTSANTSPAPAPWKPLVVAVTRWRRLVALVLLVGTALSAAIALSASPTYRATGLLMLSPARAKVTVTPSEGSKADFGVGDRDLNTEARMLTSRELIKAALGNLETVPPTPPSLADQFVSVLRWPLRVPGLIYDSLHDVPESNPLDRRIARVRKHLQVEPVRQSNLIQVSLAASSPERAARLLTLLLEEDVRRHMMRSAQSTAQQFYEGQRGLLADRRAAAEGALDAFDESNGFPEGEANLAELTVRLASLLNARETARAELAEATALDRHTSEAMRDQGRTQTSEQRTAPSPVAGVVMPQLIELQLERNRLLGRYAPTSEAVREIDRQIAAAQALLEQDSGEIAETTTQLNPAYQALEVERTSARTRVVALDARIAAQDARIEALRQQVDKLELLIPERAPLVMEVETAQRALDTYARKAEEARFTSELDAASILNLTIAERPSVPTTPEGAPAARLFLIGLAASAALSVGAAFARERIGAMLAGTEEAPGGDPLPTWIRQILGEEVRAES